MFLLIIGMGSFVNGFFIMYVSEEKIDYNSQSLEEKDNEIEKLTFSIDKQGLRSDGFGFIAIGIAMTLGSYPFFESIINLRRKFSEDKSILFPMLTKSHGYLEDMIKGYLECIEMIESQTEFKKKIEKIHLMLTMRTSSFLEYSDRTEKDIFFLQIKKPDLYVELVGIIQTNRLLLNHKQFDDVQYSYEREWLVSWINKVKGLIPELRAVNQEIMSLEN